MCTMPAYTRATTSAYPAEDRPTAPHVAFASHGGHHRRPEQQNREGEAPAGQSAHTDTARQAAGDVIIGGSAGQRLDLGEAGRKPAVCRLGAAPSCHCTATSDRFYTRGVQARSREPTGARVQGILLKGGGGGGEMSTHVEVWTSGPTELGTTF